MAGVTTIVAAYHQEQVGRGNQKITKGILSLLGRPTNRVEKSKVFARFLFPIPILNRSLQSSLHFLRFPTHHRRLIGHSHRLQMLLRIKSR